MKRFCQPRRRLLLLCSALALPVLALPAHTMAAETLLERLLRISGLSAAPGQLRGPDPAPGSLWVVTPGAGPAERWTSASRYAWPVFAADGSLYALDGDSLVRITAPGLDTVRVLALPGVVKLVGFEPGAHDDLILLRHDTAAPLAALALRSGALRTLALDLGNAKAQHLLGRMRGQDRGNAELLLLVQTQSRRGLARTLEWTDIMALSRRGDAANLSRCDGVNCSQPALSADGRRVVFVKADER